MTYRIKINPIAAVGDRVQIRDVDWLKPWLRNERGTVIDVTSDDRENFYQIRLDNGGNATVVDDEIEKL